MSPPDRQEAALAAGLSDVETVILCGGPGTRLKSVLGGRPKALAPIGDRAFIEVQLAHLTAQGLRRFVLALGYGADAIWSHLMQVEMPSDVELLASREAEPLGTGGALALAATQLRQGEHALVINGDTIVEADFAAFRHAHRRSGRPVSILCTEVADRSRYGGIELDETGCLQRFVEKRQTAPGPGLISAGVYLFDRPKLGALVDHTCRSLEHDVFERAGAGTIHCHPGRFPFIDIGTPESLADAEAFLARLDGAPDDRPAGAEPAG